MSRLDVAAYGAPPPPRVDEDPAQVPDLPPLPEPPRYPTPEQVRARMATRRTEALTELRNACAATLAIGAPPTQVMLSLDIHADDVHLVCNELREIGWNVVINNRYLMITFKADKAAPPPNPTSPSTRRA